MATKADSQDITIDESLSGAGIELPFDRVRLSYDAVAANYAHDLADEILAKPSLSVVEGFNLW